MTVYRSGVVQSRPANRNSEPRPVTGAHISKAMQTIAALKHGRATIQDIAAATNTRKDNIKRHLMIARELGLVAVVGERKSKTGRAADLWELTL